MPGNGTGIAPGRTPDRLPDVIRSFRTGDNRIGRYHSLPALTEAGFAKVSRLPRTIALLLESALRHCADGRIPVEHVERLATWHPRAPRTDEVSFLVNRVLLPDSTGIPLLADLAAMRSAARRRGFDATRIEPRIQVDLVVDHSVQIDAYGRPEALAENMRLEMARNEERFRFIKWGAASFDRFTVVPPGVGICHQVNLERLAQVVGHDGDVYYPDLVLGADSHTPMVNGLGVLGWGVGGIEAEAAMLGQPTTLLIPDVVGVVLDGRLPSGATTTDLALTITQRLRAAGVVGKFVEFLGDGAATLSVPERATLANMAPEYGATVGYFPVDENTLQYLRDTGRSDTHVVTCRAYFAAQQLLGPPSVGEVEYSETIHIDLSTIEPSVAGPRRPQDRIPLAALASSFRDTLAAPIAEGGYARASAPQTGRVADGQILLAAITSCTNTANPLVMIAAGLIARNAVRAGLSVDPAIKTSFSPGSRRTTDYLAAQGLIAPLEALGFHVAAYGCGTCLGNSGPLDPAIEEDLAGHGTVGVAVLSGNRNFEARVHPAIRANFLASPPLVVAFAIAGRIDIDFEREPLGHGHDGVPVFLRDIWPDAGETAALAAPGQSRHSLAAGETSGGAWDRIAAESGPVYDWPPSTYVKEPPFFSLESGSNADLSIAGARPLLIVGDGVTTDHISPAGSIKPDSEAGRYLQAEGVQPTDLNTFAARRGNHDVMVRGTFANPRLRNRMVEGREGSVTRHMPSGAVLSVFEAAERYKTDHVPLVIFAGREYGTGSSRDWAAKGPSLLGVRAVIAESFERIHRGNLVGLGILPCVFAGGDNIDRLALDGSEVVDLVLPTILAPGCSVSMTVHRSCGSTRDVPLILRADTMTEIEYLREGGIMPYVLERSLHDSEC